MHVILDLEVRIVVSEDHHCIDQMAGKSVVHVEDDIGLQLLKDGLVEQLLVGLVEIVFENADLIIVELVE